MIDFIPDGNLFDSSADALLNPVNCKGFMGKGIALEFSRRFPEIMPPYKAACLSGDLRPGALMLVRLDVRLAPAQVYAPRQAVLQPVEAMKVAEALGPPPPSFNAKENSRPAIILFPTKDDWKFRSRLEWIDWGLATLRTFYRQWGLESIAMPQVGCGLGGLDWRQVKPLVERYFRDEPVRVEVYLSAINTFKENQARLSNVA